METFQLGKKQTFFLDRERNWNKGPCNALLRSHSGSGIPSSDHRSMALLKISDLIASNVLKKRLFNNIVKDLLVFISGDNHSIEVYNRRYQTTLFLDHNVEWQLIKIKKDIVMAARREGSIFHMKSWKVDETEQVHQQLSFHSNLKLEIELSKFDVNGDCIIIENIHGDVELWTTRDTVPTQISFPNCDSFYYGKNRDCQWLVGQEEEVLVAVFQFNVAVVFKNFTCPNYVYRIDFPKKYCVHSTQLTEIDVGNGHFKTVLVAECTKSAPSQHRRTVPKHYYQIYDLSTGELVAILSNGGCKSVISGSYVFPNHIYEEGEFDRNFTGIDISRINWNSSSWDISTHNIKIPDVADDMQVSIANVTDTLVIWNLWDESFVHKFVVCDYLL